MNRFSFKTIFILQLCFLLSLFFTCGPLPTSPYLASNTKFNIVIASPTLKAVSGAHFADTLGTTVRIGIATNLTNNLDSAHIRIVSAGICTDSTAITGFANLMTVDTAWHSFTLRDTGSKTIYAEAYVHGLKTLYDTTYLAVCARPNHPPRISVSLVASKTAFTAGETCSLAVVASDPDAGQMLRYTLDNKPVAALFDTVDKYFKWTTTAIDTGVDTLIFRVIDNGFPPMADSQKVIITVSSTKFNHPPQWQKDTINEQVSPGNALSLTLSTMCSDPDNDTLQFMLLDGVPLKDTIIAGVYKFMPLVQYTGVFDPRIVAKDPAGLADTITLKIAISTLDVDATVPTLYFISPSKETIVGIDSCKVQVICKDESGIASLNGLCDTTSFIMSKSATADSIWTGMVKGLPSGKYATIRLIATDASTVKNKDSVSVRIKYDGDVTGPVITLITPAQDSISTNSSNYTVTLQCTDASVVSSVNGAMGTASFTGVRGSGNVWTIALSGLTANTFNTIVFTATDSSLRTNKTLDTLHIKSEIINGYTITFDKNDVNATGTMATQTINNGSSAPLTANTFTNAGWTFAGWANSATGVVAYADKDTFKMGMAHLTLFAKWTINQYTVTFNSQGGSSVASQPVNYGGYVTAPTDPTRDGYTFKGWFKEANCTNQWSFTIDMVNGDVTFFAKWTINQYTVTFNYQDGRSVTTQLVNYGGYATAPTDPTRDGYTFKGWFKETVCTNQWVFATDAVTGPDTLYAKWIINQYTVTFNSQGGSSVASQPVNYGEHVTAPTDPTRSCYRFNGWFKEAGCTNQWGFSSEVVTGDMTIYAKWAVTPLSIWPSEDMGPFSNSVPKDSSWSVTVTTDPSSCALKFQWWKSSYFGTDTIADYGVNGDFSGPKTATLVYKKVNVATTVWCIITDLDGKTYQSAKWNVTFKP